jgi:hypothetical protein
MSFLYDYPIAQTFYLKTSEPDNDNWVSDHQNLIELLRQHRGECCLTVYRGTDTRDGFYYALDVLQNASEILEKLEKSGFYFSKLAQRLIQARALKVFKTGAAALR